MARAVRRSKSPGPSKGKKPKTKASPYKKLFEEIDRDGSGGIDALELQHAMVAVLGVQVTTAQVHHMMETADVDGDGLVDLDEFTVDLIDEWTKVLLVDRITNRPNNEFTQEQDPATWSAPTDASMVAGIPDYATAMDGLAQTLIQAQDYTNYAYSEDYFIARWKLMRETYPNMGLPYAADMFVYYWGMGYGWPMNVPETPIGNPNLNGLILGQIYDPLTPYEWSLEMKKSFPMTALITSNDIRHGADASNMNEVGGALVQGVCFEHISEYLLNGVLPIDGTTCGTVSDLETFLTEK